MRFLRTVAHRCPRHPDGARTGFKNGDIRCARCATLLGYWNEPWRPKWVSALIDWLDAHWFAIRHRAGLKRLRRFQVGVAVRKAALAAQALIPLPAT